MEFIRYPKKSDLERLLARPTEDISSFKKKVLPILNEVKQYGDRALIKLTEKFDDAHLNALKVGKEEIQNGVNYTPTTLKEAIQTAADNIEKFHRQQLSKPKKIETTPGVVCWRKSIAIEKVGLYVPGGSAPLFSTVLMLGIPAKLAGCKEIILCTPPSKDGFIHPAILFTAHLIGITSIYKIGGAQAIAAMTYSTESVPSVNKIFGPGNQFVTSAKMLANEQGIAIDMPAGASEVLVVTDETSTPQFVAADLLSQAEHGADSQVILIGTDEIILKNCLEEVNNQLELLPRKELAQKSLQNSKAVLVNNLDEAMELSNFYAPEHLILATNNASKLAEKVINAGSVFIGHYTPESAGDYASGTNHTLPTNGFAKTYSGVSIDSFVKKVTFQEISKEGILNLGKTIEIMAENEQLHAHKNAVSIRLDK